jgi:hypothetical protein
MIQINNYLIDLLIFNNALETDGLILPIFLLNIRYKTRARKKTEDDNTKTNTLLTFIKETMNYI